MRALLFFGIFFLSSVVLNAQQPPSGPAPIYFPEKDAKTEIANAIEKAKAENKNVVLMIGGNWCKWCRRFQQFIDADAQIDSTIKAGFVFEHLNYSKENKNLDILAKYKYPQRFGFPVFIVLDSNGNLIHTQNSAYLEDNEGYSKEKTIEFFSQWNPSVFNPENYIEKK